MLGNLFGAHGGPNAQTGTTPPIFIRRAADPQPVKPGEYFFVKVHAAQAAFRGTVFSQVKQLVITSKVNLHHPALGDTDVFAIQRSRDVRRDRDEQLGLSPDLIALVPASMSHVSVSIDFILDLQNNLQALVGLINDDSFLAAVSLAPGAAAVAKTVGGLAQKVIQAFIPAPQQQPILQFAGDFNIGAGGDDLVDGYYAILGTSSPGDPIPRPLPALTVGDGGLCADGQALTGLSYVVLDVTRVPMRTRQLNGGAAWERKLTEAESAAQEVADDPFADDAARREAWKKCTTLLQDAKALLLADVNYTEAEAAGIYKAAYKACADRIAGTAAAAVGPSRASRAKAIGFTADTPADRERMDIPAGEDLGRAAGEYAQQVERAHRVLRASGVL